jgi:hypothetical protein
MSFEKGSVSLRVFKSFTGDIPQKEAIEKFAANAIPSMDMIPSSGCLGWSTGRHLLDNNITEDSALVASRIRVTLVKAERKIPGALFKTECKLEELALMAARGVNYIGRAERKEIAQSIRDRMLPEMPPTLSGIDVVSTNDGCYTTAISDSQMDLFVAEWRKTLGITAFGYTPTLAAKLLCNFDVLALRSTSFSPTVLDSSLEQDIGTEFLTWLWYFSEICTGVNGEFAFMIDGPFTFVHEGEGAHEIIVRKGNPGISQEAKSALMAGKKLKKAKLTVVRDQEVWTCSIEGKTWSFNSLKVPKGLEPLDPIGTFEERMQYINTFIGAVEDVFKKFMSIRIDEKNWNEEVLKIRQWVEEKASRV